MVIKVYLLNVTFTCVFGGERRFLNEMSGKFRAVLNETLREFPAIFVVTRHF